MRILAFDISSTSTGYALIIDGYVSKKLVGVIGPPKKTFGEKLDFFAKQVKKLIKKHKPDHIVCEDIFKGPSVLVFKILAGFRGVFFQKVFETTGQEPMSIMASSARSLLMIKNTKEDAFDVINVEYRLDYVLEKDNDKTDAIVLGLAATKIQEEGLDEKSLSSSRRRRKRKRKRNKKSVSKSRTTTSSRSKPKRSKSRK
jgi:Holliday junction resolvasome RuvABC endonuclease subunit